MQHSGVVVVKRDHVTGFSYGAFYQFHVPREKHVAEAVGEYCSDALAESRAGSPMPALVAQPARPRWGVQGPTPFLQASFTLW